MADPDRRSRIDRILDTIDAGLTIDVGSQSSTEGGYGNDKPDSCWRCGTTAGELLDVGTCVPCRDFLTDASTRDPKAEQQASFTRNEFQIPDRWGNPQRARPRPHREPTWQDEVIALGPTVARAVIAELGRDLERRQFDIEVQDETIYTGNLGWRPPGYTPVSVQAVEVYDLLRQERRVGQIIKVLVGQLSQRLRIGGFHRMAIYNDWLQVWVEQGMYVHFVARVWARAEPRYQPIPRPVVANPRTNGCSHTPTRPIPWLLGRLNQHETIRPGWPPFATWQKRQKMKRIARVLDGRFASAGLVMAPWQVEAAQRALEGARIDLAASMMAARSAGRARRTDLLVAATLATGQSVQVVGPDCNTVYHPDGTFERVPRAAEHVIHHTIDFDQ